MADDKKRLPFDLHPMRETNPWHPVGVWIRCLICKDTLFLPDLSDGEEQWMYLLHVYQEHLYKEHMSTMVKPASSE